MDALLAELTKAFDRYAVVWPAERDILQLFRDFLASSPAVFERSHTVGHFTGSAWLVSTDGSRALLTHHRKLVRWLQLGGHADGDADLAGVAQLMLGSYVISCRMISGCFA